MGWAEAGKARRRLSREKGAVIKDWGGRIPFVLIYPNSYYVGMSNLGMHAIYRLLNNYDKVVCERAFWEGRDEALSLVSLESQRPLLDFAVLAFSISYELDYLNVAPLLKASGIPLYAAERDETHPLVIAGGPCIAANPMPLSPLFDLIGIGEAEAILPAMLPVLGEGIGGSRDELLEALASLPGVYAPQLHSGETRIARRWSRDLDEFPVSTAIVTPDTELGNLYLIEVERGCNWGCRFCLTSTAFRPMRVRSLDTILAQAEEGLKHRKRMGLVGASVLDYPRIEELLVRLRHMGAELSVSSLRIKPLPEMVLGETAKGGSLTIALAPEAGSQRLRRLIRKGFTEEDILEAMEKVARQGIRRLKLYFMIGLPSETDEDIEEIVKLTLKCKAILDRRHRGCRLSLNIAPFVPKAGTPFQWLPMAPIADVKKRLAMLKRSLQPKGIQIKAESPAWSQVQAVLSRGDARLAEVIAHVEDASLAGWRKAAEKHHLDVDYYAYQQWDTGQKLPWAVIDSGTKIEYLKSEMGKALAP